jgi:uncharacterized protein (TIGR03067 family)
MVHKSIAVLAVCLASTVMTRAADDDWKALLGDYKLTGMIVGGMAVPDASLATIDSVKLENDTITITVSGQAKKAAVTVDFAKKPATIDIKPSDLKEKDAAFPGLIKLEKTKLTIIYDESGMRPKDFEADGAKVVKMILEKTK